MSEWVYLLCDACGKRLIYIDGGKYDKNDSIFCGDCYEKAGEKE
jgi:hypothetical protein